MTSKEFTEYVNDKLNDGLYLLNKEDTLAWAKDAYKWPLNKKLANEIVDQWNKQNPEIYGDPFGILNFRGNAAEIRRSRNFN